MRVLTSFWMLVVLINAFYACDSRSDSVDVVFSDSGGVRVVDHVNPAWTEAPRWRLGGSPLLNIGGSDSIDVYNLFRINNVARLASGDIVVANGGTNEIRIFDDSGQYLRTIGRRGSGPGEYNFLTYAQVIRGDSIAAFDHRLARITVFDGLGNVGRTENIGSHGAFVRHFFEDGAAIGTRPDPPADVNPGVKRGLVTFMCVLCAGTAIDTIARVQDAEVYAHPNHRYIVPRPLGKALETAIGDSLVYIGIGDRYEIHAFTRSGTLRRILRAGIAPERVTRQHIDEVIELRLEGAVTEQYKDEIRALRSTEGVFPEFLPAHGSLMVGVGNELWVQDYKVTPNSRSRWHVYNSDGTLLASVETPERFQVMSIGADWIAGVWKDDLDVEYVRVYDLER